MEGYFNLLKEFMRYLYQIREGDLNRFIHTNLTDKETNEVRGAILAINKAIKKCDEFLGEYAKNMNLPYNIRILEDEFKRYRLKVNSHERIEDEVERL